MGTTTHSSSNSSHQSNQSKSSKSKTKTKRKTVDLSEMMTSSTLEKVDELTLNEPRSDSMARKASIVESLIDTDDDQSDLSVLSGDDPLHSDEDRKSNDTHSPITNTNINNDHINNGDDINHDDGDNEDNKIGIETTESIDEPSHNIEVSEVISPLEMAEEYAPPEGVDIDVSSDLDIIPNSVDEVESKDCEDSKD